MDEYIAKNNIDIYLNDAISLLLKYHRLNPSVIVSHFFADYFRSVKSGNHVLYRNYQFINLTQYNKICFLRLWIESFQPLYKCNDKLIINEIYSLTKILCPDFPQSIVETCFKLTNDHNDDKAATLSFYDYKNHFQFFFVYDEFIKDISEEYMTYVESYNNTQVSTSLSSMDWLRILNKLSSKPELKIIPNISFMKELVTNFDSLSLGEYFQNIVNSETLIKEIESMTSVPIANLTNSPNDLNDNIIMTSVNIKSCKDIEKTVKESTINIPGKVKSQMKVKNVPTFGKIKAKRNVNGKHESLSIAKSSVNFIGIRKESALSNKRKSSDFEENDEDDDEDDFSDSSSH